MIVGGMALNVLAEGAETPRMRRTWTLLPALVALLLAWPLLVHASRQHQAAHAASPVGQAGGAVTPTPVMSMAAATSAATPTSAAAATSTAATSTAATSVAPTTKASRPVKPKPKPKPLLTMVMTPKPSPAVRPTAAAPTTSAAPTTVAPRTTVPVRTVAPTTTAPKPAPTTTRPSPKPSPKPTHKPKPAVTTAPPLTGGTVTIGNFQYAMPSHVSPGARIAVYNADTVAHTLTIASAGIDVVVDGDAAGYFMAPKAPGSYLITCDYHADMTATLVVR